MHEEQLIRYLKQVAEIARRSGLRARYDFTDTFLTGFSIRNDRSVNSYFRYVDYDSVEGIRVPLLERLIRSEDRMLFELEPAKMVEEILNRGGLPIGDGQFFLRDPLVRNQHYEAAFVQGSRLMLCVPTTIVGVQYLFTADKQDSGINVVEVLDIRKQ